MKKFKLLVICFLTLNYFAVSQETRNDNLCVGHYYTEAEAKKVLEQLKLSYKTEKEWLQRAEIIKSGILEGAGLVPFPEKKALKPRFTEERKYDGYSVQNVAFESLPGVFVTGSLYLPEKRSEKMPGILSAMVTGPNPMTTEGSVKMPKSGVLLLPAWGLWYFHTIWLVTAKWPNGAGSITIRWL